mmetsp:Transcript_61432/g.139066  ORF Transcript_61432/g.139066 Transcript_61432/m.139066 type:complete len:93 (+) Transcript_61432:76-354(+)
MFRNSLILEKRTSKKPFFALLCLSFIFSQQPAPVMCLVEQKMTLGLFVIQFGQWYQERKFAHGLMKASIKECGIDGFWVPIPDEKKVKKAEP